MTPEQVASTPRKSAEEIANGVPEGLPPNLTRLHLMIEIESALNLEWWRGYYAGRRIEKQTRK